MEIKSLIKHLSKFEIETVIEANPKLHIQTHKMIKPKKEIFYTACLYVGYVSELPERIDNNSFANLICIEDIPLSKEILNHQNLNLYLAPKGTNQFDVLNMIADIMIDEAYITASMKQIIDALFANADLQSIVDIASTLFGNPIFINDTSYKILAMSNSFIFENQTLEEEKQLGYVHSSNIQAMKRDGVYADKLNTYPGIMTSKRADLDETWLFSVVKIHGIVVANIALVDNNRPFKDVDYELLNQFTQVVAISMGKNDFYKDNKGVMYSYLINDLLNGKTNNKRSLNQRLEILDWKVYNWFKVIVVSDSLNEISQDKLDAIPRQVKQIFPDCHWAVYKKNIVFFISRSQKEIYSNEEKDNFVSFLKSNHLIAGVSQPFNSLIDAPYFYKQAYRAADVGSLTNKNENYFEYSDIIPFYAAHLILKRNDILDFTPEAISIIKKHDEEKQTELMNSLETYLKFVGDPVSAALSLNIHRNTLLYRINKIKELTSIDLENGDIRFQLQLYFKLIEYQKGK